MNRFSFFFWFPQSLRPYDLISQFFPIATILHCESNSTLSAQSSHCRSNHRDLLPWQLVTGRSCSSGRSSFTKHPRFVYACLASHIGLLFLDLFYSCTRIERHYWKKYVLVESWKINMTVTKEYQKKKITVTIESESEKMTATSRQWKQHFPLHLHLN